jgi:hypothetical protein
MSLNLSFLEYPAPGSRIAHKLYWGVLTAVVAALAALLVAAVAIALITSAGWAAGVFASTPLIGGVLTSSYAFLANLLAFSGAPALWGASAFLKATLATVIPLAVVPVVTAALYRPFFNTVSSYKDSDFATVSPAKTKPVNVSETPVKPNEDESMTSGLGNTG